MDGYSCTSTMCGCGGMAALDSRGRFEPHTSRRTGEPCTFQFKTNGELVPDLYVPPEYKPSVYLVDIDGTVALKGDRGPFDWSKVGVDLPNQPVIQIVRAITTRYGLESIIFMSGRSDECRIQTEAWLIHNVQPRWQGLFMRKAGDFRPDYVVKRELFDQHIRHDYRVQAILDDRNQVVQMWREMGLTVLQVADGDF